MQEGRITKTTFENLIVKSKKRQFETGEKSPSLHVRMLKPRCSGGGSCASRTGCMLRNTSSNDTER